MSWPDDNPDASFNPFSTRFVRPDRMPYRFPPGVDSDQLYRSMLDRFRLVPALAVIGPHGTGKSTLIQSLLREMTAGREEEYLGDVRLVQLSTSSKRIGPSEAMRIVDGCALVVIDGFEQLPVVSRLAIIGSLRRSQNSSRLLVTAHRHQWFIPTFYSTRCDIEIIRVLTAEKLSHLPVAQRNAMLRIADRLAQKHFLSDEIAAEADANVRDYWFSLYDAYEQLRIQNPVALDDAVNS